MSRTQTKKSRLAIYGATVENQLKETTFLQRIFLPSIGNIIFASLLFILSTNVAQGLLGDGDTAYHIRTGEIILDTFKVPNYDPYSFHSPSLPWTTHEWLSELIMASIMRVFGLGGVVIFFALLLSVSHWLLFRLLRARFDDIFLCIVITLIATASSSIHWLARPHAFSLLFLVIWCHLLDRFQENEKICLLWFPLLMVLWVNLHGGFVMGLILVAVYLIGNLCHSLTALRVLKIYSRKAKLLFWVLIATTAACLVNPFGVDILLFPFRVASDRFIADNVIEFLPPNFHDPLVFKYMLLALIGALALSRLPLSITEVVILVLLCYMALYSARHISLFAIVVAPILLKSIQRVLLEFPDFIIQAYRRRIQILAQIDESTNGYFWPVAATFCVLVLANAGMVDYQFSEKKFPVAAVDFLKSNQIAGNMFNSDEFGDYVIYSAWPSYRVFMDGRSDMYGEKYGRDYLRVAYGLPGWKNVFEKYDISWVFFETGSPLIALLQEQRDWQPVYSDPVATIFVKRIPPHLSLIEKFPSVSIAH